MGTRNLTQVIHKGKVRMGQYGQFDGYPEGVGKDIAKVLQKATLKDLRAAIEKCVFIGQKKIDKYYRAVGHDGGEWVRVEIADVFKEAHPLLHRDYSGGAALNQILKAAKTHKVIELVDNSDFLADSLFCEWAYVIDLDKERVEVYKGFNTSPLTKKDRFYRLKPKSLKPGGYHPVRLKKSYAIKDFTCWAMDVLKKEISKERDE